MFASSATCTISQALQPKPVTKVSLLSSSYLSASPALATPGQASNSRTFRVECILLNFLFFTYSLLVEYLFHDVSAVFCSGAQQRTRAGRLPPRCFLEQHRVGSARLTVCAGCPHRAPAWNSFTGVYDSRFLSNSLLSDQFLCVFVSCSLIV